MWSIITYYWISPWSVKRDVKFGVHVPKYSFQFSILTYHHQTWIFKYIYIDRDEILLFAFDFFTCCIKYCSDIKFGPAEIKIWYICVSKGKTMGIMCIYIYSLIYVIDFLILDWQFLPNYTQIYFCLLTGKFNRYVFDRRIQSLEGKIMCVFCFNISPQMMKYLLSYK